MVDFEKRKQALWREAERAYNIPMPQNLMDRIESDWGLHELNPDNEDEVQVALSDLRSAIDEFFDKVLLLEYFSSRKPKVSKSSTTYPRSFEKRLHIVSFIIGSQLPIIWEEREAFTLLKRFDWKQLCSKWNEAHPYDHMSPEVLKVRYYRAIAEEDIQKEYIKRRYWHIPGLDKETYIKAIKAAKGQTYFIENKPVIWDGSKYISAEEAHNENTGHGN